MTAQEMQARIAELEAALKAKNNHKLSCKVGEKGGVSVYGLGRFPVTLYREQWERLMAYVPTLKAFIQENSDKLTSKVA